MTTQSLYIENGRVVDPSQGVDRVANLLILDGKIAEIDPQPATIPADVTRYDAKDKIVVPGLVSLSEAQMSFLVEWAKKDDDPNTDAAALEKAAKAWREEGERLGPKRRVHLDTESTPMF